MGKNAADVQDVPDYQSGTFKLGGASSTTTKNGNNITSEYHAAPGEQQSYDYIQSQMPTLAKNATNSGNFDQYVKSYTDNQKDQLNLDYLGDLNKMKGAFGTSGQMRDSGSLDQLRPFETAHLNALAKINAEAPRFAQELRAGDQTYNTNAFNTAQNGLNSYYNLGRNMNQDSLGLSKYGNEWAQTNYENRRQHAADQFAAEQADKKATMKYIKAGAQIAGAIATGGASLAMPGGGVYGEDSLGSL